jgi:hypothetical protein
MKLSLLRVLRAQLWREKAAGAFPSGGRKQREPFSSDVCLDAYSRWRCGLLLQDLFGGALQCFPPFYDRGRNAPGDSLTARITKILTKDTKP